MEQKSAFNRNIKNIVYVMFEHRSFDNLLGNWLPCSTPIADAHESFEYVTNQLYGGPVQPSGQPKKSGERFVV